MGNSGIDGVTYESLSNEEGSGQEDILVFFCGTVLR